METRTKKLAFFGALFGGKLGNSWEDFTNLWESFEQGSPKAIQNTVERMASDEAVDLYTWHNHLEVMLDTEHFASYFVNLLDAVWEVLREKRVLKADEAVKIKEHLMGAIKDYMVNSNKLRSDVFSSLITVMNNSQLQSIANTEVYRAYLRDKMDWR